MKLANSKPCNIPFDFNGFLPCICQWLPLCYFGLVQSDEEFVIKMEEEDREKKKEKKL